jgi:hypothetical protein
VNDNTRKLLKFFGVAVTGVEAEVERLAGTAAQLSASAGKEEIAKLLKDGSDLCQELNTRWLEIIQRVFSIQNRLQQQMAEAVHTSPMDQPARPASSGRPHTERGTHPPSPGFASRQPGLIRWMVAAAPACQQTCQGTTGPQARGGCLSQSPRFVLAFFFHLAIAGYNWIRA